VNTQHTDVLVGRDLLLDVACTLFMQNGYDGVSMQQIASAANMTKGSPYYHFKGKEDLFVHVFIQRVTEIHSGLIEKMAQAESLRDKLVAGFVHILTTTDPGVIRLFDDFQRVIGPDCSPETAQKVITADQVRKIYQDLFALGHANGERLRVTAEQAAFSFQALQMGTLVYYMNHAESPVTVTQAAEIAGASVDIFLHGALNLDPA
jgi:AcrR family transcriptional regulator